MQTSLGPRPTLVPKGYNFTKQYVKDAEVNRDSFVCVNSGGWTIQNQVSTQIQPTTTYTASNPNR
jgi:hypothetical protein